MKKKGFTLVELLAVIAILAILVIIALPNVLSMYNEARKNAFTTEVKDHYKAAEQKYMLNAGSQIIFSNADNAPASAVKLEMSGNKKTKYYMIFNANGDCTRFVATNGTYGIDIADEKILIEDIGVEDKDGTNGTKYAVKEADTAFTVTISTTNGNTTATLTGNVKGAAEAGN